MANELEEQYGASSLVVNLKDEMLRKFKEARQSAGQLLTAAVTGDFKNLIEEYESYVMQELNMCRVLLR
ncbi:MAG: hypothetical protein IPJ94_23100 [Chloroflexi bacterium]|nr:hypothetical protein [Chloroflexota bacterium]